MAGTMAMETPERNAVPGAESVHRDFHAALSAGIEYLDQHYGADAVREFLWGFAKSYYAPLNRSLRHRGLSALREHIREAYRREEADVVLRGSDEELWVEVAACPAVTHIRSSGYPVARLFAETLRSVYKAVCDGTPYAFELIEYDDATGRSIMRFRRRPQ